MSDRVVTAERARPGAGRLAIGATVLEPTHVSETGIGFPRTVSQRCAAWCAATMAGQERGSAGALSALTPSSGRPGV